MQFVLVDFGFVSFGLVWYRYFLLGLVFDLGVMGLLVLLLELDGVGCMFDIDVCLALR